ncbi:MAG TPA: PKD domain-containing protein [Bacteroidia bacterium]|nr:PKD domain-containing protein [Bacteroidia bacterium]
MKTRIFTLSLLLSLFAVVVHSNAATFTYNNGTAWQNWNVPANWTVVGFDADGLPDADDDVTIPTGFQVTANLTSSMNSLTIDGDIRFRNPVTPTLTVGTLNMNGGTLGHSTSNRVGIVAVTGDMKLLTGTCTIGEVALTVAGTLRVYSIYNENSSVGTITFGAVQMYNGSNWTYNNTETFTVTNNFTMKGATVDGSATGRFNIGGNLVVDSASNNWGRSRLVITGTLTINSGATYNVTSLTGTKSTNNIDINAGGTWEDLVSESWSISGNIENDGTFNAGTGTYTLSGTAKTISGSSVISFYNTTCTGSYTNNGIFQSQNTINSTGTFSQGVGGSLELLNACSVSIFNASAAGNTVIYSGGGTQNIRVPADGAYHHLTLSNSATKRLVGATVVNGDLSIGIGTTFDVRTSGVDYQLNLGGNWTNLGSFTERLGLVVFDGTGAQLITNASLETFYDLQFSNSGTKTLAANIQTTDDLDILSPAVLDAGANFSITVKSDWTNTGTFIPQQGTVALNNTTTGSINGAGVNNFYNLTSVGPDNNLNTSANLAGTLTIPSGNFETTGQIFTLTSDASNTGNIASITAPRFTGNITMQRHIPGTTTGWGLLGSCITTTLASWTDDFPTSGFTGSTGYAGGFISIYSYLETAPGVFDNPAAYVAATNATDAVAIGSGRWVYLGTGAVTTSDITVDVTGAPKIGNQNFGVTFTSSGGASEDGWNLVANPYPSNIDWNSATGWTKSNVSGTIYIWNADFNQFATWNGTTGTNGGSRYIASSQGFYVQTTAAAPVLSCTENVKTATSATMLREAQNNGNGDMIRFIVKGQNQYDETLFGFRDEATAGFDVEFDAVKMRSPIPTSPSLTQVVNNKEMAMNFVSNGNRNAKIELRFLTPSNGDYTLNVEGLNLFPENECVILKDLKTGAVIDLKKAQHYDFYAFSNDTDIRFVVEVSSPLAVYSKNVSCGNTNDGAIEIQQLVNGWNYNVYNSNGIIIGDNTLNSNHKIEHLMAGEYTVKFDNGGSCNVLTQKATIEAAPQVKAAAEIASIAVENKKMKVVFNNKSENGSSTWDFGDGEVLTSKANLVEHVYQNSGTYTVKLTVKSGECIENQNIVIKPNEQSNISIKNNFNENIKLNQVNNTYNLQFNFENEETVNIDVINVTGQFIHQDRVNAKNNNYIIDLKDLAQGTYILRVYDSNKDLMSAKLIK